MKLFVALQLAEESRRSLARAARLWDRPQLRRVPERNYHLTLQFLGDPGESTPEDLTARLSRHWGPPDSASQTQKTQPSVLASALSGWDAFPTGSRPRVVFAAVEDPGRRIASLADQAATVGLSAPHRPFVPHITVAYPRHRGSPIAVPEEAPRVTLRFTSLALVNSSPGPGGSRYTILARWSIPAA